MPRSPSRDLSDRYIGHRDYFRQPKGVRRWKALLGFAALGLVAAWALLDTFRPAFADPLFARANTHGDLAGVHAAWDAKCDACHRTHGIGDVGIGPTLFGTSDRWHDLTCNKCHQGPTHHANMDTEGRAYHDRCSNCHHDHGGRTFSLTRITDDHCTKCHADLPRHTSGTGSFEGKVSDFAANHPEFRAVRENPPGQPYKDRRLKFSHALHMTPGQASHKDGKGGFTRAELEKLSPGVGRLYRTVEKDLIQLDCASCHRLDAGHANGPPGNPEIDKFRDLRESLLGQPRESILTPRNEGAYFLPVNFDAHCKSCHPLRAADAVATVAGKKEVVPFFDLPHRKQPAEMAALLKGEYAARLAAGGHKAMTAPAGPGGRPDARPAELEAFGKEVDRLADTALRTLLLGANPADAHAGADKFRTPSGGYACGKCHDTQGEAGKPESLKVQPLQTPDGLHGSGRTVWFAHAKFSHVPHRGTACATCHPGTGAAFADDGATKVVEKEPVQIVGVKTCQACHSPAGTTVEIEGAGKVSGGGVRHGCADCHRYHGNENPLRGRGDPHRDPQSPYNLAEFLKGKKE